MAKKYISDNFEGTLTGTASGNLPLSGGLMTGDIKFDPTAISQGIGVNFANTTTSNDTLKNYEWRTFTPGFDIIGGSVTVNWATVRGVYVRVGNIVTAWMEFKTNSLSLTNGSGAATITGLPYTVGSILCCPTYIYPAAGSITNVSYSKLNNFTSVTNATNIIPTAIPNTTYLQMKYTPHGSFYLVSSAMTGTQLFQVHSSPTPAANEFSITITYYTEQ